MKTFYHPSPNRLCRDTPYPEGIIDDIGRGFVHGLVYGSAFHFLKGIYNSPPRTRFIGALDAVRMNAPRVGGHFGVWNSVYSAVDCTMLYARQKDDPWNTITAGTVSGGLCGMRQGLRVMALSAVSGGVLFALVEGGLIMYEKKQQLKNPVIFHQQPRVQMKYSNSFR